MGFRRGNNLVNACRDCVSCLNKIGFGCRKIGAIIHLPKTTVRRMLLRKRFNEPKELHRASNQRRADRAARYKNAADQQRIYIKAQHKAMEPVRKAKAKARALAKYYSNHEENKKRSRDGAKRRWHAYEKHNPKRVIRSRLRRRLWLFAKGISRSDTMADLIGCSWEFLHEWLESKFTKGMSWKNYGRDGWHIDHVIPCSSFNLTTLEHRRQCFHYTNLQPLWRADNLRKSDTISNAQPELVLHLNRQEACQGYDYESALYQLTLGGSHA